MQRKFSRWYFVIGCILGLFFLFFEVKYISAFSFPKPTILPLPTRIPFPTRIPKPQKPCLQVRKCEPTVIPTLTPTPVSLPLGVISWWKAESNSNDSLGTNNGVLSGTTFVLGKIGQSFNFNGISDYIQTATNGFPTGNSNRTIELWVKINLFLANIPDPHSPLESFFVGYGNFGSGSQTYQLGTAGNVLYFSSWGPALFGPSLQAGIWYHVAVTNEGNNVTLFLNGTSVATGVLTINTASSNNFYMGRIPGALGDTRRLNGLIDEIIIYNRALTPLEIHTRANTS